jgi:U6 snRNA-associated Sm-like protein LSm2
MLFYSFFKTILNAEIEIELKNDIILHGTLVSVDQYMNIRLANVSTRSAAAPWYVPVLTRLSSRYCC